MTNQNLSSSYIDYHVTNLQKCTSASLPHSRPVTFDRLRLMTSVSYIDVKNPDEFEKIEQPGTESLSLRYETTHPFHVWLHLNYDTGKAVMDFSGKTLLDDYPLLISTDTIQTCFENINRLCAFNIDIEAVLQDSTVVQCDVTSDVASTTPLRQLASSLMLKNNKKWCIAEKNDHLLAFQNTVSTKRRKMRLIVYDKWYDMDKAARAIFLNSVTDPDKMTEYFNDKIRFELKLNSVDRLRHCLKIESTSLFDVLYSQTDPIATVLDEVMEGNIYSSLRKQCPTMKSLLQLLLIAFCNYEATNVETVIRDYLPPKSSPTRQLEKFKPMLSELNKMQSFSIDSYSFDFLRSHLMSMLAACTVNDDTLTLNGIYKTNKNLSHENYYEPESL